jgi:hypothetical protein
MYKDEMALILLRGCLGLCGYGCVRVCTGVRVRVGGRGGMLGAGVPY